MANKFYMRHGTCRPPPRPLMSPCSTGLTTLLYTTGSQHSVAYGPALHAEIQSRSVDDLLADDWLEREFRKLEREVEERKRRCPHTERVNSVCLGCGRIIEYVYVDRTKDG